VLFDVRVKVETRDGRRGEGFGSMPLGNGDITLNAWMTKDGDLQFYIGKTDAWDDNARLLKVGKVRVHFEPNPMATGQAFRQELKLREGCIEITTGAAGASKQLTIGNRQLAIRLWVDANHPVIHITADSATPMEATAFVEVWRTNQYEMAEVECSDVMNETGKPKSKHAPTILEPDTLLTGLHDRVGWFHHNIKSVGPEMLAQVQGLTGFKQPDPLLHRTFGAVVTADKGERLDDQRLRSPRGNSHRFSIFVLTQHPSSPEQWMAGMDETIRRVEAQKFAARRQAHNEWWGEFWNRSWISVSDNAVSAEQRGRLSGEAASGQREDEDGGALVAQSDNVFRFLMACQSRGRVQAKFNGGLFTQQLMLKEKGIINEVVYEGNLSRVTKLYDDVYFSRDGGLDESRAVFLTGCGLPEAWAGRRR